MAPNYSFADSKDGLLPIEHSQKNLVCAKTLCFFDLAGKMGCEKAGAYRSEWEGKHECHPRIWRAHVPENENHGKKYKIKLTQREFPRCCVILRSFILAM